MVHACWNLRRTWTMVNETLNLQMSRMEADLAKRYADLPERSRAAAAFEELAKQPALPLLYRYEARQNTEYQRALKTWLELRKNVPLAPAGALLPDRVQNEPTVPPEPAPVLTDEAPDQASQTEPLPDQKPNASQPIRPNPISFAGTEPPTTNHQPLPILREETTAEPNPCPTSPHL